jgi:hypothetical protein
MSAFQVTATHLAALVQFHQTHTFRGHSRWEHPGKVFRALAQENVRSLKARYEGDTTAPVTEEMAIEESMSSAVNLPALSAVQAVSACDSYDYQSCETRDYFSSEAAGYIREIRDVIIRVLAHHAYPETIDPCDPERILDPKHGFSAPQINSWHL